jgi:glycosyltransferase involved in cell wall biosynthesis
MSAETLRIAFATPEYVTEKYLDDGIANYVHRVAKALAAAGHDIHVLTKSERAQAAFEHEGVTVHRVTFAPAWLQLNRLTRYRLTTTMHLFGLSAQVYRRLKQLHAERPFHLVQFPNCSYCGLFSILCLRVPHVLRASSYQPAWNSAAGVVHKLDSKTVELLEGLQFRLSRNVYAPSRTVQQMLLKEAGLKRVRIIPTPCYVETQDWDDAVYNQCLKGKQYLLFYGRFEQRKGFHCLAQALPRFLAHYPEAYAVLVGRDMPSALAPSMATYARTLSVAFADRLIMLDSLPHRQLYPVIAGARLVVLPSLMDNLPNACLEAMALGKVVVGTSGASFDELIDDEATGFLVAPDDVAALTEKINYAWTHPKLQEIGRAAQQRMADFAPEKTVQALLTYYREVLSG